MIKGGTVMESENADSLYKQIWTRISQANEGYIYYDSLKDKEQNKPLINLYEKVDKKYKSLPRISNIKDIKSIGLTLKNYGLKEREKELDLITSNFGDLGELIEQAKNDNGAMVRLINEVFNSTEEAKRLVKRIKELQIAQTKVKKGQSVSLDLNDRLGGLFILTLNEVLRELSNKEIQLPNKLMQKLALQIYEDDIDQNIISDIGFFVIQETFERLARRGAPTKTERESRVLAGKRSARAQQTLAATGDLFSILSTNNKVIKAMADRLLTNNLLANANSASFSNTTDMYKQIFSRYNDKGKKQVNFLKTEVGEYRGKAAEDIGVGIIEAAVSKANKGRKKKDKITFEGTSTKYNAFSADEIYYFGKGKITFNIDNIINGLAQNMNLYSNKDDAVKATNVILRTFQNLGTGSKNFLVFESTKEYNMSQSSDFHFGGTTRNYDSSLSMLNQLYPAQQDYNSYFLSKLLNTMSGAIAGENKRQIYEMKDDLRTLLAENFAGLLFDDFTEIGERGNVIHIFNLNGVRVPLSALLLSAGNALLRLEGRISDLAKFASIQISIPKTLTYTKDEPNNGIFFLNKWEEQREKAKTEFSLSIHFYKNFQQELLSWYN